MSFSESIKEEVKKKAAFRCCRCQELGVDVHHIIPQKDGGSDDIENAAPLCQNCHSRFGDNPQKRKEIIQMRDWWYEKCGEMFSSPSMVDFETLKTINSQLEQIKAGQENQENLVKDIKQTLSSVVNKYIDKISAGTATTSASAILNATEFPYQIHQIKYEQKMCPICGKEVIVDSDNPQCHRCGYQFEN